MGQSTDNGFAEQCVRHSDAQSHLASHLHSHLHSAGVAKSDQHAYTHLDTFSYHDMDAAAHTHFITLVCRVAYRYTNRHTHAIPYIHQYANTHAGADAHAVADVDTTPHRVTDRSDCSSTIAHDYQYPFAHSHSDSLTYRH